MSAGEERAGDLVDGQVGAATTWLLLAIVRGDFAIFAGALDRGADVNARDGAGRTALHWAAFFKRTEMVNRLLVVGAEDSSDSQARGLDAYGCEDPDELLQAEMQQATLALELRAATVKRLSQETREALYRISQENDAKGGL